MGDSPECFGEDFENLLTIRNFVSLTRLENSLLTQAILKESLILAQDERWRRG